MTLWHCTADPKEARWEERWEKGGGRRRSGISAGRVFVARNVSRSIGLIFVSRKKTRSMEGN